MLRRGLLRRALATAAAGAVVLSAAVVGSHSAAAAARSVADGFTLSLVTSGLNKPHAIRYAPDGRLFLLEQDGEVSVVRTSGLTSSLVIDPANAHDASPLPGIVIRGFPDWRRGIRGVRFLFSLGGAPWAP